MTDFNEIDRLYKRYFNIEKEIDSFIKDEEFEEAELLVSEKNRLIMQIINARKTASDLTDEQIQTIFSYDKSIREKNETVIEILKKSKDELELNLKDTNKKVKVGNAYSMNLSQKQGVFVDLTE